MQGEWLRRGNQEQKRRLESGPLSTSSPASLHHRDPRSKALLLILRSLYHLLYGNLMPFWREGSAKEGALDSSAFAQRSCASFLLYSTFFSVDLLTNSTYALSCTPLVSILAGFSRPEPLNCLVFGVCTLPVRFLLNFGCPLCGVYPQSDLKTSVVEVGWRINLEFADCGA